MTIFVGDLYRTMCKVNYQYESTQLLLINKVKAEKWLIHKRSSKAD